MFCSKNLKSGRACRVWRERGDAEMRGVLFGDLSEDRIRHLNGFDIVW